MGRCIKFVLAFSVLLIMLGGTALGVDQNQGVVTATTGELENSMEDQSSCCNKAVYDDNRTLTKISDFPDQELNPQVIDAAGEALKKK